MLYLFGKKSTLGERIHASHIMKLLSFALLVHLGDGVFMAQKLLGEAHLDFSCTSQVPMPRPEPSVHSSRFPFLHVWPAHQDGHGISKPGDGPTESRLCRCCGEWAQALPWERANHLLPQARSPNPFPTSVLLFMEHHIFQLICLPETWLRIHARVHPLLEPGSPYWAVEPQRSCRKPKAMRQNNSHQSGCAETEHRWL